MATEHTPGHWLEKELMIYAENGNGETLATVKYDQDAEFIVRACNNHQNLLAVCKELTALVENISNIRHAGLTIWRGHWAALYDNTNKAKAVIAAAEKKSEVQK